MKVYKWKWKVLGALGCMRIFKILVNDKQHCVRCVYYLSEITIEATKKKKKQTCWLSVKTIILRDNVIRKH